jgi:hypothetical protein
MHDEKGTDWREHYRQVLFEADPEKLQMGIEAAHQAVQRRICELRDVEPADTRELSQLAYASYFLGLLSTLTEQNQKPEGPIYSAVGPKETWT